MTPPAHWCACWWSRHASHFAAFLLFGLGLWLARREAFGRFGRRPAPGDVPGYRGPPGRADRPALDGGGPSERSRRCHRRRERRVRQSRAGVCAGRSHSSDPIAAMPSLHRGLPGAGLVLVGFHHLGARAWPLHRLIRGSRRAWAAVVLGEHYFLDLVAGVLLAAVRLLAPLPDHAGRRTEDAGRPARRPCRSARGWLELADGPVPRPGHRAPAPRRGREPGHAAHAPAVHPPGELRRARARRTARRRAGLPAMLTPAGRARSGGWRGRSRSPGCCSRRGPASRAGGSASARRRPPTAPRSRRPRRSRPLRSRAPGRRARRWRGSPARARDRA